MKKCKWLAEFEGVCCNASCMYCADCPPAYYDCESNELCKHYEKEEEK